MSEFETGATPGRARPRCLVVIPALDERDHIGALVRQVSASVAAFDGIVVVADGGSTDGTVAIVEDHASRDPAIRLCLNPRRIQSSGVNRAVEEFGDGMDYLIRIDAHGLYPDDFCDVLVREAVDTKADSVVVAMRTVGEGRFQSAVAAAQNSRLGTGGSRHRMGGGGGWVDHGHHALMRIEAFRAVGGYDEAFARNEDAELDHRLRARGFRIWMTGETEMTYFPRRSAGALFRQYFGYGRGRAQNMLKHRALPKVRQALPLLVAPAALMALFAPIHWLLAVPLLAWMGVCIVNAFAAAVRQPAAQAALASYAAMVMHLAWSAGFWLQLLGLHRFAARSERR